MYSLWTVLPAFQTGSYSGAIAVTALLFMAAGCVALSSLRQALCYAIAACAGLVTLDIAVQTLLSVADNVWGLGAVFAIGVVGVLGFAVGFAGGLTAAVLRLPKPMFTGVGEMTRLIAAALVMIFSFIIITLACNTDFFADLARDPSGTLRQFFTYLVRGFMVAFS